MNRPLGIIDLHCDTLTRVTPEEAPEVDTINSDGRWVISLNSLPKDVHWAQFFAIFLREQYRGADAVRYFNAFADSFYRQADKFSDRIMPCFSTQDVEKAWEVGKTAAILTVENALALGGEISNVEYFYRRGVRCMSIVWNGPNELASGSDTDNGFTDFGRQAVKEMERIGILVDVSHLNDRGFYELLEIAEKPFVATHSNARSVHCHRRNLTDDMISIMAERNCLVGLNYYNEFINGAADNTSPDGLYRHICRFFELGAQKNLALGSDFDGCTLPEYLNSPEKIACYYEYLLSRGLSEEAVDGIFWKNAMNFLKENLK